MIARKYLILAEREGFEPPVPFWGTAVFETAAFDHSAISPREEGYRANPCLSRLSAPDVPPRRSPLGMELSHVHGGGDVAQHESSARGPAHANAGLRQSSRAVRSRK